MSDARANDIKMRIVFLKDLKNSEMKSWKPSETYIADLNISIEACEKELSYAETIPAGYEMVSNG